MSVFIFNSCSIMRVNLNIRRLQNSVWPPHPFSHFPSDRCTRYVPRYLTKLYPRASYFVILDRCEWSFRGLFLSFRHWTYRSASNITLVDIVLFNSIKNIPYMIVWMYHPAHMCPRTPAIRHKAHEGPNVWLEPHLTDIFWTHRRMWWFQVCPQL